MSDETVENSTIRKYLLGDLPESEVERIERWYFAGGQAVDEVWAAFGELAEERMSGALSENDAQRFDQRLRSSPALLEMFENEKAIHAYAARNATAVTPQVKGDDPYTTGRRQWRLFGAFFRSAQFIAAAAVALVVFGAFGLWLALRMPESPNPKGAQQAEAQNQQDQKDPNNVAQPAIERSPEGIKAAPAPPDLGNPAPAAASRKTMATLLLLAGGTRGGESYATLEISGRTETVQLELEPPTDDCAVFSAVLRTESGEEVQRWERAPVQQSVYSPLKMARIRVRAGSLKNAGYVVRLECVSGSNNPASNAEYHLKVEKK
jgi:hypothetical protein